MRPLGASVSTQLMNNTDLTFDLDVGRMSTGAYIVLSRISLSSSELFFAPAWSNLTRADVRALSPYEHNVVYVIDHHSDTASFVVLKKRTDSNVAELFVTTVDAVGNRTQWRALGLTPDIDPYDVLTFANGVVVFGRNTTSTGNLLLTTTARLDAPVVPLAPAFVPAIYRSVCSLLSRRNAC